LVRFDYKLKGIKDTLPLPVTIQVAPKNEILQMEKWPPATRPLTLYIHSKGKLESIPYTESQDSGSEYQWSYDPSKPTPQISGNLLFNGGSVDNIPFITERQRTHKDIIILVGQELEQDTIIAGVTTAVLYVSSSLNYVDFNVRLLDFLLKDNTSMNVCDGFVRISPSNQPNKNENGVFKVEIQFYPTAYKFERGHSLMIQISSGAHPYRGRNTGTGEPLHSATTFLSSQQQLFISNSLQSQIIFPVLSN